MAFKSGNKLTLTLGCCGADILPLFSLSLLPAGKVKIIHTKKPKLFKYLLVSKLWS